MSGHPEYLSRAQSVAIGKRRRGRNVILLLMLVALIALFFGMSVVKLSRPQRQEPSTQNPM